MNDVIAVMPSRPHRRRVFTRRAALLGGLALAGLGAGAGLERFLSVRPNALDTATQTYRLDLSQLPAPGAAPLHLPQVHAFLVNLKPGEGGWRDAATYRPVSLRGGLVVLSEHCTYRGCDLVWPTRFPLDGDAELFRCPCCGSQFTKSGLRVFGPAQRALDTLALHIDRWSGLVIRYSQITRGGAANPEPAVPLH